jgi:hypothetical protein
MHLLHLVGILFPHNIDDARSKPHQTFIFLRLQLQAGFDKQLFIPCTARLNPDKLCNVNRTSGTRGFRYYVILFNLIYFKLATRAILFRRSFLVLGRPYTPRWLSKGSVSRWHPGHWTWIAIAAVASGIVCQWLRFVEIVVVKRINSCVLGT